MEWGQWGTALGHGAWCGALRRGVEEAMRGKTCRIGGQMWKEGRVSSKEVRPGLEKALRRDARKSSGNGFGASVSGEVEAGRVR